MTKSEAAAILLVEDSPDDAEMTLRALRKRGIASTVHVASDGTEALDYLFGSGPTSGEENVLGLRLVLLDWKLPKISGLEVLRRVRAHERTKLVPVVVLTSSADTTDIRQAYLAGANSYIVKPVDFKSFMDVVGNLGTYWLVLNQAPLR